MKIQATLPMGIKFYFGLAAPTELYKVNHKNRKLT